MLLLRPGDSIWLFFVEKSKSTAIGQPACMLHKPTLFQTDLKRCIRIRCNQKDVAFPCYLRGG